MNNDLNPFEDNDWNPFEDNGWSPLRVVDLEGCTTEPDLEAYTSEPNDEVNVSGRSTKKRSRTVDIGQTSGSQQPERKRREELNEQIEKKSVPEGAKILNDRVKRLKDKDMKEDMDSHIYIQTVVMANNADYLFKPIVDSYDQIKRQWPARSDLEKIGEEIKLIKSDETMEEREKKQRLKAIGEEITRLKEQREKDSKKVNDLEEYFTNPGVSVETLGEKLSSACPWLDLGEIATNGPTANQDQRSVQTREQLHYTDKDFDDLKNKVFAKDNNKVDVLEFPGLKEAIENARGNVPDYLQPIASKIERDRGTPTGFELFNIQLLVCAAINEMVDLAVEKLDSRMLLKWGATLNKAKQFDFQVKFADNLLEKSFCAYIGYSKKSSEIKG